MRFTHIALAVPFLAATTLAAYDFSLAANVIVFNDTDGSSVAAGTLPLLYPTSSTDLVPGINTTKEPTVAKRQKGGKAGAIIDCKSTPTLPSK